MLKTLIRLKELFRDESGNVQSTEYILMIVLLAIGGVVGLATLRDQVAQELADTGVAMEHLDQTYVVAVPGVGYNPAVAFNQANWVGAGRPATFTGYTVSAYDNDHLGTPPPPDTAGTFPGSTLAPGMAFVDAAAGAEKTNAANSDGDSNN